jgi:mono/diheme cytochrome c family protein
MKKSSNLILAAAFLGTGMIALQSCTSDPLSPGLEYMPDMYRGISYETYSESPFSENGSALKPVSGTIPRFNDETLPYHETYAYPNTNEGYEAAGLGLMNPYPATELILEKGKQVYTNFCVHCHGEKGDGNGTLVQRDKFAGVPSYYSAALKDLPEGKMYHTIYYGKNMMGSHASQINYAERWAVIRYVQKLRADGLGVSAPSDSTTAATADSTAVSAAIASKK